MSRSLRRLAPAVLLVVLAAPLGAQPAKTPPPERPSQERHSEVRLAVPADARRAAERLAAHGVHLDHVRLEETPAGRFLRTVLSQTELAAARAAGLGVEVLVEDLAAEVAARPPMTEAERRAALRAGGIQGNVFGSMGGFPTFAETVAILDDMHAQYPTLISPKVSLGRSHEGRDIWMVEVSDHPGQDEGEREALINALHHAREPAALTTTLYFLWYLLENYDTDPEVRRLVDTRRVFVVPVLNPDGYVYNETTNPNGGGFWRKNRRNNGSSRGVDLNRNYDWAWGFNNSGSSPTPSSETYRGPAPFSEPELVALRDFFEGGRAIRTAFNYHTYGDLLLYGWAYDYVLTPDDRLFELYAERLTDANGYDYGSSPFVLYPSNGNANDWMYGQQTTKPKTISFTPEVGAEFWPLASQIVPLAQENVAANLELLRLAGFPTSLAADLVGNARAEEPLALRAPNPVSGTAPVAFVLAEEGAARLAVYDLLGREVAVLVEASLAAGAHEVAFEAGRLAAGVYLLRLTAGSEAATLQLVVTR